MAFKFNIIAGILACANARLIGQPGASPAYPAAPVNSAYTAPLSVGVAYSVPAVGPSLESTYSNYAAPATSSVQALRRDASPIAYSAPAVAPIPIPTYAAVTPLFYSAPVQVSYSASAVTGYGTASAPSQFSALGSYGSSVNPC